MVVRILIRVQPLFYFKIFYIFNRPDLLPADAMRYSFYLRFWIASVAN